MLPYISMQLFILTYWELICRSVLEANVKGVSDKFTWKIRQVISQQKDNIFHLHSKRTQVLTRTVHLAWLHSNKDELVMCGSKILLTCVSP